MNAPTQQPPATTRWFDSSWELDADTWPTEELFLSLPLMRLSEDCCGDQLEFRYATLERGGDVLAGAVFHRVALRAQKLLPATKNRWHSVARRLIDRVDMSVWMCGSAFMSGPSSYWIRGPLGPGARWLAECMRTLHTETGRPRRTISIVKDLPLDHAPVAEALTGEGFQAMTDEPVMVLDLDPAWTCLDDYVSALKSRYRREYRRTRAALEGVERRELTGADILARAPRFESLYRQVLQHAYVVPVHLNARFFARLADDLGAGSSVLGYFADGELIAFNSRLIPGAEYESYIFGMDYAVARERCLYKNILFDDVADAIARGCTSVHLSRCSHESKSALGARPLHYTTCARHPSRWALSGLLRMAERMATATWVERNPFRAPTATVSENTSAP